MEGGSPVVGGTVTATDSAGPVSSAPTGTDGSYTVSGLEPGSVTAVATDADGLLSSPQTTPVSTSSPTTLDFTLTGAGSISGTITAAGGGAPPADTTVSANADAGGVLVESTVNPDGTYTITDLPPLPGPSPDGYTITATDGTATIDSVSGVEVTGGITTGVPNLQLAPTATLTGTVTDASTGNGVAGVTVFTDGAGAPAPVTTDANGNYTLAGVPAIAQNLHFSPPDTTETPFTEPITPSSAGPNTDNAALIPAGTFTATIQTSSGQPLTGQPVVLVGPGPSGPNGTWDQQFVTDDNGQVTSTGLLPGNYDLQVPGSSTHHPFTISVADLNAAFTLSVPVAVIQGTVTDGGVPVAGIAVYAADATHAITSTVTDSNGNYTLDLSATETVDVMAGGVGFGVAIDPAQRVTIGSTTDVDLQPGSGSFGLTVTAGGDPVEGAIVTVTAGAPNDASAFVDTLTGSGGTATEAGLTPGNYTVAVSSPGDATSIQTVTVASGANSLTVALVPGGAISGTITDAGGPVDAAQVQVVSGSGFVQTDYTNTSGVYTVAGLPAGTYQVSVSDGSDAPSLVSGVVVNGGATATSNATLTATGDSAPEASCPLER
jgi:hypothetical protein